MYVQKRFGGNAASIVLTASRYAAGLIIFIGPIAACGNGTFWPNQGSRPTLGSTIEPSGTPHVEEGNNHVLELAQLVEATDEPQLIKGRISSAGDVDVYNLGAMSPGDRVRVEVDAAAGLYGVIGLFDDSGSTLLINDHRNVYLGRNGPFIDITARRASSSCLVAFAATPGFDSVGTYELAAVIEPGASPPRSRQDVFLLDFEGGRNVKIGTRAAINVPKFDAKNISVEFGGMTPAMISQIVSRVRSHFAGYNITILSTSETFSDDESISRVYFGTYDSALLGVADGVDEYNSLRAQHAIVFTDTFEAFDPLRPTVAAMAQAIANVASHEIGHLLGLVHTKDPNDVMDVTASLRQLLEKQAFGRAPIYEAVFPLGDQDSIQMLLDSVGGDATIARAAAIELSAEPKEEPGEKEFEYSARDLLLLGGCGLHD